MDFNLLFDILDYQQQRFPNRVALAGRRPDGQWHTWTTADVILERDRMSAGLLEVGIKPGDRVGLLTHKGSPRWVIADAALLQIGAVPVPIHATARPDEVAHIARDADLKACFVSNAPLLNLFRTAAPQVSLLIGLESTDGTTQWEAVACDVGDAELERIRTLRAAVDPHALATLLYTSGTTGVPKGVMLSHANIVSNIKSVLTIIPVDSTVTTVSYLPLSHIFERSVCYLYQVCGTSIWYADSIETLPATLREVRPHFFTAVPRVLERTYERLLERRDQAGFLGKKLIDWAIALGERYPYAGGRAMPLDYRIKRWVADLLVYRRWRKAMGGRVQSIAVGAAALQPRLGRLFSAAGVDVREGYGLTETSPVVAFNRFEPGGVHFGTVGIPAPGVEVRIAEPTDGATDGEVEVRGPNVMLGYLGLPEETASKMTPDGWLRTGDLGHIEHKRFLRITGRKSEVFKTTSGKFVAPAYVEEQLLQSPFVDQCMAIGLNRPHVGALIVPNFQHLEAWCAENQVHWTAPEYMILNPKIEKLFRAEVDRISDNYLSKEEKIKTFALLTENWTAENGLLTPTLKMRRNAIEQHFSDDIKRLF
jgi:long-chain acyl-CoA synthetase